MQDGFRSVGSLLVAFKESDMKLRTLLLGLAIAGSTGVPLYQTVGRGVGGEIAQTMGEAHGMFNIYYIMRAGIFASIFIVLTLIWGAQAFNVRGARRIYFSTSGCNMNLVFYVFCFLCGCVVLDVSDLLRLSYNVFEWLIIIIVCCILFTHDQSRRDDVDQNALLARMSCWTAFGLIMYSIIGLLFFPDIGDSAGPFRLGQGISPQMLGCTSALAALCCFRPGGARAERWLGGIFVGALLASFSRSAIGGFLVSGCLLVMVKTSGVRRIIICSLGIFSALCLLLFGEYVTEILSELISRGQDAHAISTFNSRSYVWDAALEMISESPWLARISHGGEVHRGR